jgi:hypothetical protein
MEYSIKPKILGERRIIHYPQKRIIGLYVYTMATKTANVTARVPFSLDIPDKLATRDSITQAEFDTMMQTGLAQAKRIDAVSVDEAFNQLKAEI